MVIPGAAPEVPWPATGQAALSVEGLGSLGTSGGSACFSGIFFEALLSDSRWATASGVRPGASEKLARSG